MEHKCACNVEKPKNVTFWSFFWASLFLIAFLVGVIYDGRYQSQARQIELQRKSILEITEYQTDLNKIIVSMSGILSNQTEAIKDLRDIIKILDMSSGGPSNFSIDIPAMEEMQPSTTSTNGIDVSGIDLFGPDLITVMKDRPWALIL